MKISLTGTFSVSRTELEGKITEIGHNVIDFSKKTDMLIVGEKTASESKIKKAEAMGIKIIRDVDAEKVIALFPKKYVSIYDRERAEVVNNISLLDIYEVYQDFAYVNGDAGEWNQNDIEHFLKSFEESKKVFCDWLKIEIDQSEEKDFWIALRRLMIMDIISWEFCDYEDPKSLPSKELASMPEDEFRKKILSLFLIEFNDQDDRGECLGAIKEDDRMGEMEEVLGLGL